LRQHEHTDAGLARSYPPRGHESLVGVRRRHLDIDDRNVGLVPVDLAQQLLGVPHLAHHVGPRRAQQRGDARADEDRVVGDDYPHGISARRPDEPACRRPPSAPTRSRR